MDSTFKLDRLLETLVKRDASEAWLVSGKVAMVRRREGLQPLATDPLTVADVRTVLTSDDRRVDFERQGWADFTIEYGDSDFWVTIYQIQNDCVALLRYLK